MNPVHSWDFKPNASSGSAALMPRNFYERAPDVVARELLGKALLRRAGGTVMAGRIVETEAYFGTGDEAAHASRGKTERNAVLFGPPGHAYVYFIYGVYHCLNISCEPEGMAGCVLIRALEPLQGVPRMARNRGLAANAKPAALTAGPGRLCQALDIRRELNGKDVTSAAGDLTVWDDGYEPREIAVTKRIGISKAADRPLRFYLQGNPCVSRP